LGSNIELVAVDYRKPWKLGGAWISFHPSGHILGASQVRIEVGGKVAVISGDYKRQLDPTCESFEVVECDLLVTESTFGLPVFQWPSTSETFESMNDWWRKNQTLGKTSLLLAYAVGKSQRLLAGLDTSIGPIYLHGAVDLPTQLYRSEGVKLPETRAVHDAPKDNDWSQCMVLATPSAQGTPWLRRFGSLSIGMASGWMAIRGTRRRQTIDRGFVVSDHADWPDLIRTINDSKASTVWVTHGFADIFARFLNEKGIDARPLSTRFVGEPETETE
jgi:putative mRNA 3-end processing factor